MYKYKTSNTKTNSGTCQEKGLMKVKTLVLQWFITRIGSMLKARGLDVKPEQKVSIPFY